MGWKFWKKSEELEEYGFSPSHQDIPISTLARWYLYDTVENPNEIAPLIGLTPVSEEGDQSERRDSEDRVSELEPFLEFVKLISEINAAALIAIQSQHLNKDHPEQAALVKEEEEVMEALYRQVGFVGILSALSAGLAIGIIENPGTTSTVEMDMDYE